MHISPAVQKFKFLEIKNGATILKTIKHGISAAISPILIKFGTEVHTDPPNSIGY